jgi:hypothetical protein
VQVEKFDGALAFLRVFITATLYENLSQVNRIFGIDKATVDDKIEN